MYKIYNPFYALNVFPEINYRSEEMADLPSLPDLSLHFATHTTWGTLKKKRDPRFPIHMTDAMKKCYTNFAVWRECLSEHVPESLDPEDPKAYICKRYQRLAYMTCPVPEFKRQMDMVERDIYFGIPTLNKMPIGRGPTVVVKDNDGYVHAVLSKNENTKRLWYVGKNVNEDEYEKY